MKILIFIFAAIGLTATLASGNGPNDRASVLDLHFSKGEQRLREANARELADFVSAASRSGRLIALKLIIWTPEEGDESGRLAKKRAAYLRKFVEPYDLPVDTAVFESPWEDETQGSAMAIFEE